MKREKHKIATREDFEALARFNAQRDELRKAIADSSLIVAKSVSALSQLELDCARAQLEFAKKYDLKGEFVVTPDCLIIDEADPYYRLIETPRKRRLAELAKAG